MVAQTVTTIHHNFNLRVTSAHAEVTRGKMKPPKFQTITTSMYT